MGLAIKADLDTDLGSSKKVYVRIENINLNRTFGRVKIGVTYWVDQKYSEVFKHSEDRHPQGQISDLVVFYENEDSVGQEINLPTFFEFDLARPIRTVFPIYETKEISEEVPYVKFDELGRRVVDFRTVSKIIKQKVGEKEDITQVLDFDIEKTLISWCYGQVKAQLAKIIPGDLLEDN